MGISTIKGGPLTGVQVVERAGRLSVAACAHLLAALGAQVVRLETAHDVRAAVDADAACKRLLREDKEVLALPEHAEQFIAERLATADVVLLEPITSEDAGALLWRALIAEPSPQAVVCVISPSGLGQTDLPLHAREALIQAACGLMAVTGESEEQPELVRAPIAELTGAVVALTAVLAALRVRRRDGMGQLIDLSLTEAMADQLRTHIGLVRAGQTRGFRIGCRHPLCSPWNVYRARDGWVMICSASDQNWRGIVGQIGRDDLVNDERYARASDRVRHTAQIDLLMRAWVSGRTVEEVVASMAAIGVPAGPALDARQVPKDPFLIDCGAVHNTPAGSVPRLAFRLRKTACVASTPGDKVGGKKSSKALAARLPLEGVRVVELTRYAAGPLPGYLLSSLGAEVIKVEPPGGEETRTWKPRFGKVSAYFANFNAGKRFVSLDLKQPTKRERLRRLIATADVVLHNMRPGAIERLGLGAEMLTADFPRLIYCAVSGYGLEGPQLAAFDTVIQARLGLTSLMGDGEAPMRIGYSIADQLAGHYAAAGVIAALTARDETGAGQVVDVSMADAMAWLTHLAWSDGGVPSDAVSRIRTADGWVIAEIKASTVDSALRTQALSVTRGVLVQQLTARGIAAAAVLEVDEVLSLPSLQARRSVYDVRSGDAYASIFVAPYGLTGTPVSRARSIGEAGQDNEEFIQQGPDT